MTPVVGRGLRLPDLFGRIVALSLKGEDVSDKKQRRSWTPDEKAEIVLAGGRTDRSVRDVCRKYETTEAPNYQWHIRQLARTHCSAQTRSAKPASSCAIPARRSSSSSGRWVARTTSWRSRGTLAGLDVSIRVSRARAVIAHERRQPVVAALAGREPTSFSSLCVVSPDDGSPGSSGSRDPIRGASDLRVE